ncbi:MAG TPA: M48 family metalloprotease [Burkholderiales bacterium]|nr:M48 family metalloprotease [Burkholderiales bacterium]
MRRVIFFLLAGLLLAEPALPAAAQNLPDLGGTMDAVLTPQMERRIGENTMREIRYRDPSYVDDPEVTAYLQRIGERLAEAPPGAKQRFEFFGIRDNTINAFALPGGFVGVNTGLIMAADDESELASVLAHEISHVTQRHIARQLAEQQKMQLPTLAALAAAILLGRSRPDLAVGAAAAVQGASVQSQLAYSREFEREADRIGFQRLVAAGFDPHGMPDFFEKMERYTRISDDSSYPTYLRDHPLTPERIADAENRADQLPYRQHIDSLEFFFVRARLRAESGDARDQVAHFRDVVRDKRYSNEAAARYGLVLALLRAGQAREAEAQFALLRATHAQSPMIEALAARVSRANGDLAGALEILRKAQSTYPDWRPLVYAYIEALQDAGRYKEALAALAEPLRRYPDVERLRVLQAKTYAALGKRLLQHQAQAEVYVLQGSLPAAIEQLQLARSSGDGDFYQLSEVDSRMRELKAQHQREQREQKQP